RVTGINTEYALLGGVRPGAFVGKPSIGGRLKFESSDSKTTLALSHVNLFMEYDPADIETTFTENANVHFYMTIMSLKYNLLQWSFTSEYAQRSIRFDGFPSVYIPDPLRSTTGESFYFQTVYRLNYKWNLIARYDVLYSDKTDRNGESFVQSMSALGANIENHSRYAKDMMFGIQFNISRHWESRFELHAVDGSAWIPARDNLNEPALARKWHMINMSISYQF
ncbi:MAG: hypothetical protein OEX07_00460, partial [Gammaproteobacteria bacterium]|nr:hypothetical protein [Gammaproteobacteria bacterium]